MTGFESKRDAAKDKLQEPVDIASIIACREMLDAQPVPAREPRNVRERWNVELDGNDLLVCFNDHEKGDKCQYERYSPQREWVGLTDDEIDYQAKKDDHGAYFALGALWAGAKLKERNHGT